MNNECAFSPCRKFRYTLLHSWRVDGSGEFEPAVLPAAERKAVMWIGLNPSTADEQQLDNTLRRVRSFSHAWGFNTFIMTNVFAFRATKPKDMHRALDPIGPDNDRWLVTIAKQCERAICCWGAKGNFPVLMRHRAGTVRILVRNAGCRLFALEINRDGSPKHPLYVLGSVQPVEIQA